MNSRAPPSPIAPGVSIGHVHLKVADLERKSQWKRDLLAQQEGAVLDALSS